MTDVSISDIERICHDEIRLKLSQLDRYIERVGQRLTVLKRTIHNSLEYNQKVEKIESKMF